MSRLAYHVRASAGATVLAVVLMVLLESATASATAGRTFYDARNETPGAPDIRKVTVSQEGDVLQVDAEIVGLPIVSPGQCDFALDTDGDPTTGSIAGAEYLLMFDLKTFQGNVLHWNGTRYVGAKKVADPSRTLVGKDSCGLMFNLANFGWPETISLTTLVVGGSGPGAPNDVAPDSGEWRFPIVQQPDSLGFTFEPARPVSGTTFAATAPSLTLTDKTTAKPSRVTCEATIAGSELPAAGSPGACRWQIPADAAGEQLVLTATASYRGTKITYDPWKFRVG